MDQAAPTSPSSCDTYLGERTHSQCRANDFALGVLCDNAGAMELDGTNTWVLSAPGADACVIVDPGPGQHRRHVKNVLAAVGGRRVDLTLVTHRHDDHAGGTGEFAAWVNAPVRAFTADQCVNGNPLRDCEVIRVAGLRITVLHTPGHSPDSICLLVETGAQRALVTGDTIVGTGTVTLEESSGALRDYLASLNRLLAIGPAVLLPGHGPYHDDSLTLVRAYRDHRQDRLDQVRRYLRAQGMSAAQADVEQVRRAIYPDLEAGLVMAARWSTRAQLAYLAEFDDPEQ